MKRLRPLLCLFVLLSVAAALTVCASAVTLYVDEDGSAVYRPKEISPASIVCDGVPLESDIPAYITNGRTMVPVRLISETLGATVEWIGATRQVLITLDGREILLTIGSATAIVDGEETELYDGIPAVIAYDGLTKRTMVPLRFVAEQLGASAEWDGETRSVVITPAGSDTSQILSVTADGGAVAIVCEGECTPSVFTLTDPNRIVIDFPGGVLDASVPARIDVGSEQISAVRINQYDRGYDGYTRVARVVIDLAEGAAFTDLTVSSLTDGSLTVTPAAADGTTEPEAPEDPDAAAPGDETQTAPEEPAAAPVVVLDAGHGGSDPGTQAEGLDEKDLNLAVTQMVAALLEQQGITVVCTRTEDVYVTLADRAALANAVEADIFVSIHTNASSTSTAFHGIETYHLPDAQAARQLASAVHASVLEATGANDHNVRTANYYVLRETDMPAILVEMGYVTNAAELAQLLQPEYRAQLAQGIAAGILAYLGANAAAA